MPFTAAKQDIASRLFEIQNLHRYISSREAERLIISEIQSIKGLFIVNLYGFMEFSVSRLASSAISYINQSQAKQNHLITDLCPVFFDDHFKALSTLRGEKNWNRRHDMFESQCSKDACSVDDNILGDSLQNLRSGTIILVAKLFTLRGNVFIDNAAPAYINELCERRNAVAHGRESPTEVGRRYTSLLLNARLQSVSEQITYLTIQFEEMIKQKHFIKSNCRRYYP